MKDLFKIEGTQFGIFDQFSILAYDEGGIWLWHLKNNFDLTHH